MSHFITFQHIDNPWKMNNAFSCVTGAVRFFIGFGFHCIRSPSLSVSHGEHKSYTDIPCIYFNDNTTNIDTDCWKHSLTPSDCYKATTITDMQSIHQMAINNSIYLAHTYTHTFTTTTIKCTLMHLEHPSSIVQNRRQCYEFQSDSRLY